MEPAPTIVLAANDPWNILNYRVGLIRALQSAGFRIAVFAPAGPQASEIERLGVDFYPVPMSPRGTSPLADSAVLLAFVRRLRAIRPAAFLGFTAKPNVYGSIAARLCGVPVINNISGLGSAFAREGLLKRLLSHLYRIALRRSGTVFFQNRDDLELFRRMGLVRTDQAALLPGSGIDTGHFAPAARESGPQPFTFLFAARLLWDKGVREYVEAAQRLKAGGSDVRFQILGFVEPESRAAVPLRQLQEWHAAGAIEYLGSSDDIRDALRDADCVVLPSYYREGVPRVLLEAAAMAIPVITTDAPGCREAVEDRVTGLLCEPRSVDSLEKTMLCMMEMSPEQRQAMGTAGRAKMEREFREDIVHRAYLDALGKLGVAKG